jgi:hypothetical protein
MAFLLFLQKNDPNKRIVEGFHQAVAVWLLNSAEVPVLHNHVRKLVISVLRRPTSHWRTALLLPLSTVFFPVRGAMW